MPGRFDPLNRWFRPPLARAAVCPLAWGDINHGPSKPFVERVRRLALADEMCPFGSTGVEQAQLSKKSGAYRAERVTFFRAAGLVAGPPVGLPLSASV